MGGKACVRGLIVGQIGVGRSLDELLADYPYLEREDLLQALRCAASRAGDREIMLHAPRIPYPWARLDCC